MLVSQPVDTGFVNHHPVKPQTPNGSLVIKTDVNGLTADDN